MVSRLLYILFLMLGFSQSVMGQLSVDPGNSLPINSENLIQNVFLGSGIEILEIEYFGDPQAVGLFENASPVIGLDRGIIMTTGYATDAVQNSEIIANEDTSRDTLTDEDLAGLLVNNIDLIDLAKYEITFIPTADTLRFRYVFASEEYPDFVCSSTNDVFGFFIDGPNPSGGSYNFKNIALIPDPMDPTMSSFLDYPVSVNFVNSGEPGSFNTASPYCEDPLGSLDFSMYYNPVSNNSQPIYNAYLDIFIAEAAVIPCQEYTIKIAIADGRLGDFDSAVFLEEKSFSTNSVQMEVDMPGINGGIAEGCEEGILRFSIPKPADNDKKINFEILSDSTNTNNAVLDQDFTLSSNSITIPQSSRFTELSISALEDFIPEEEEYITLVLNLDPCTSDTIIIPVNDNSIADLELIDSLSTCAGKAIQIPFSIPANDLDSQSVFRNNLTYTHSLTDSIIRAPLSVEGMPQGNLNRNNIAEICIESFSHLRLNDCDFYLEAPNGNLLELSTDNGTRPNNDSQVDSMIETCFTIFSGTIINLGDAIEGPMDLNNPTYTGLYLPEGNMENWLFPLTSPINGIYTLIIADDKQDEEFGTLTGWNIKFRAPYERRLQWSANASFNCTDCAEPFVRPMNSEFVNLNISDSYGCVFEDSVWIETYPIPETPILNCLDTLETGLVFTWNEVANATDYEVRINEQFPWFSVSGNNSFLKEGYSITTRTSNYFEIEGLLPDEEISIIIKAISENGCESERDTVLCSYNACTGNLPVIDSILIDQPLCDEQSQVRVDIFAQSQSGMLTYRIDYTNVTIQNNTGTFFQVPQGTWPIRIIDENGCAIQDTLRINDPTPIVITEDITKIECYGDLGAISIQADGGAGNYSYSWAHGPETDTIEMLPAGIYELTVTDSLGCTAESTFTLEEPDSISYSFVVQDSVGCNGIEFGSLLCIVDGGTFPYSILWENGQTGPVYTSNSIGYVTFSIVDSRGCVKNGEAFLPQSDLFDLEFNSIVDLKCADTQTGSASVDIVQNHSITDVQWANGEQGMTAISLTAGYNQVTVTNESGCTISDSVFIDSPDPIFANAIITQIGCSQSNSGAIELMVTGGTAIDSSYSYLWENGTSDRVITHLDEGRYCVTITDDAGCELIDCYEINRLESIGVDFVLTEPACEFVSSGAIEIEISGGTGNYTVDWTGPGNFTSNENNIDQLSAGIYTVNIADAAFENCDTSFNIALEVNSNPAATFQINNPISCSGASDGSIEVIPNGLAFPVDYNWSNNANTINDSIAVNLPAGIYSVSLTGSFGCQIIDSFELNDPDPISVEFNTQKPSCEGESNGSIEVVPTGGTAPFNYEWSNGESNPSINQLSPGLYIISITDANGCNYADSIILEENNYLLNPELIIRDVSCNSNIDGSLEVRLDDEFGPYLYSLDQINYTPNNIFNNLEADIYTLFILDGNGCERFYPFEILKTESINIDIVSEITVSYGSTIELNARIENGNPPYSIEWISDNASNFSCLDTCLNPVISDITSSFSATIDVVDADGCTGSKTVNIFLKNQFNLYVPQAFSPNNDLVNDRLDIFGDDDLSIQSFQVFDRSGTKVFESNAIVQNQVDTGWDGTINNSPAPQGSYLWLIEAQRPNGTIVRFRGQTILLK